MRHKHPEHEKHAMILRLRKIRGQVESIENMVASDADCADVLTQVTSVRRALKSFGDVVIQDHMHDCIENAKTPAESRQNLRALLTVLERYVA